MIQNMHDENERRRADNKCKSEEMSSVINRVCGMRIMMSKMQQVTI